MASDANKQLVVRFYNEVWARGNVSFATEVFADDYVRHDLRATEAAPGPAGQAKIAEQFRRAFPDLQWQIDVVLAEGDLVAARWTASGTHTGSWSGLPPTGKQASFSGVNIFRFDDDGKVAEIWNHRDDLGLMEQLGAAVFAGAPSTTRANVPGRSRVTPEHCRRPATHCELASVRGERDRGRVPQV